MKEEINISAYTWRVEVGKAMPVNPYSYNSLVEYMLESGNRSAYVDFEQFTTENTFATDAPDGVYQGDQFELVWQYCSHISGWQDKNTPNTGSFDEWKAICQNRTRQFLRLKQQPKEVETVEQAARKYAIDFVYPVKGLQYSIELANHNRGMVELLGKTFQEGAQWQSQHSYTKQEVEAICEALKQRCAKSMDADYFGKYGTVVDSVNRSEIESDILSVNYQDLLTK